MAAPRPTVTVTLDKERVLTFDMRALYRAEGRMRELRKTDDFYIFDFLQAAQRRKKMGVTEIAVLLWAGLSVTDPDLKEDDVLAVMGPSSVADAAAAITKSLAIFFSTERRAEAAPAGDGPLSVSPGSSGGPSPDTTSASPTRSSGG